MASTQQAPVKSGKRSPKPLAPDGFEKLLGGLAVLLLALVLAAMVRGGAELLALPWNVALHFATMVVALAITPVMMWRQRGDRWHRRLGWIWSILMVSTALVSFTIRDTNTGNFSFIHILSVLTLVLVPLLIWEARRHKVDAHRSSVRGLVTGAVLIAGFFTLPFGRMLGRWLFG